MLALEGIGHRYGGIPVLTDLSLALAPGEIVGVLGENGVGKTTLLRVATGLLIPTEGHVRRGYEQRCGAVVGLFEGTPLAPRLSARANLELILRYLRVDRHVSSSEVDRALDDAAVGAALRDLPTAVLSQGNRQRVRIAAALLSRPELLVLDEPHQGLDEETLDHLRDVFGRLAERGLTVLMATHLLSEVERGCTRAVVLRDGTIAADEVVAVPADGARFVVAPEELASETLEQAGFRVRRGEPGELLVDCPVVAIPALVAALVAAGVAVEACGPVRRGLGERLRPAGAPALLEPVWSGT